MVFFSALLRVCLHLLYNFPAVSPKTEIRSPLHLIFSRLAKPSSPSLCLCGTCSSPPIIMVVSSVLTPVCPCLDLDRVLRMLSHRCGVEGKNRFPGPAGCTLAVAAWNVVGHLLFSFFTKTSKASSAKLSSGQSASACLVSGC